MVRFSIIVPVYKAEDTIERCVESIRKQTIKDIEILLVDDGNTDRSGEKCDSLAELDHRIKVIHQENAGPSVARNVGIENATGQWVMFCDSDDELVENACEKYLEKINEGNYDVVIADIFRVEKEQRHIRLFDEGTLWESQDDVDALARLTMCYQMNPFAKKVGTGKFGYGGPWNKAISLALLKEFDIRFPESIRQYEDRLFNIHVYIHATKIGYLSLPVYKYYATENSLTRAKSVDLIELDQKIINEYKCFFIEHPVGKIEQALEVMITERFVFMVRTSFSKKIGFRDFRENYRRVKSIRENQEYSEALSKTRSSFISGFDKYMVDLMKRKVMLLPCLYYSLRGHLGR